ncbi:MAG: hypothetical protein KDN19_17280 [Verrucomicrobiae bacterium]|nr:hypothetical protein [Verrucomicrobiae bacterium]
MNTPLTSARRTFITGLAILMSLPVGIGALTLLPTSTEAYPLATRGEVRRVSRRTSRRTARRTTRRLNALPAGARPVYMYGAPYYYVGGRYYEQSGGIYIEVVFD